MTSTSGTSSNFGHLDYPNLGMGLSSDSTTGYSRDVIDLAEKLKYQHECIMHQQFSDEFYLQYAKNMLNMTQNSKFDKVLSSVDAVPDPDYAQYSYEEIITMSNNGVNIPTEVLAWAKAQREADVIDYTIVSDDVEYNDVNSQDKETGESEINKIRAEVKDNAIKSKKAQEDVEKDREKSGELTSKAIDIARKQKNILQNNSIDKIKDMADEWKSLDKKKQEEGKLDASEEAKYKKLSKNLKQGGAVIEELQKNSDDLDDFLESIDTLTNDANEGLTTAQKTIDSSKNFSKLDDRLNIFQKVHAYKIAEKGSGLLEDALVNVNDTQLAYVAEKIGQDLIDIGNAGIQDVTNENTQEAIEFSKDYITKTKHIESTLGIAETEDSDKLNAQGDNDEFKGSNSIAKGMNEMFEDAQDSFSNPFGFLFGFLSNPAVAVAATVANALSTEYTITEATALSIERALLNKDVKKSEEEDKKLASESDKSIQQYENNNEIIVQNSETISAIQEKANQQQIEDEEPEIAEDGTIEESDTDNLQKQEDESVKQTEPIEAENANLTDENKSLQKQIEKPLDKSAKLLSKSKKSLSKVDSHAQVLDADVKELLKLSANTMTTGIANVDAAVVNAIIAAELMIEGTTMLAHFNPFGAYLCSIASAWFPIAQTQLAAGTMAGTSSVEGLAGAAISTLEYEVADTLAKDTKPKTKESQQLITETAKAMGGLELPEGVTEDNIEENTQNAQIQDENSNMVSTDILNKEETLDNKVQLPEENTLVVSAPVNEPVKENKPEPTPVIGNTDTKSFAPSRTRAASVLSSEEEAQVANSPETSVEPQEEAPVENTPEASVEPQEEETPVENAPEASVEPKEETQVANAPEASVEPQEETPVANAPEASVEPQEEETPVANAPEASVEPQEEAPVENAPETSVEPQEEETPVANTSMALAPARTRAASVSPSEEEIQVANAPEASVEPEEETPVANAPETSVEPQEEETPVANTSMALAPARTRAASVSPSEEEIQVANAPEASVEPQEEETQVKNTSMTLAPARTRAASVSPSEEEIQVANAPEASVEPKEEAPVENAPEASVEQQEEAPVENAPETSVEPQEETPVANAPEASVEPQEEAPVENAPEASVEPQEEAQVANASEASVEPQEEETPVANTSMALAPARTRAASVSPSEEEIQVANAPEASVEPQEETPVENAPEASVEPQEEAQVANAPEASVEPQEETPVENAPEASVEPQEEAPVANAPEASVEPQEETPVENAPEASVEPQEEETQVANASEASVEPQEESANESTVQEPSETPAETESIYVSEDDTASNLKNIAASGRSPQDILNNPATSRSANTNIGTNNNVESSTNSSDKNEKTDQKEKEQIEDTQKTMKALYGTNVDFTKAFVGAEVATAVGMGPASYIMQIAVWGGIVAASVLDLLAKNLIVGKSSEIAENEVKNSADFVKSLDTNSKAIIAEHTKNMAEAKLISNEYKELNNQSIDYQFAMMQDQAKLVEAGKISADEVIDYPDPFAGNKQNLEAKLQGLSDKDSQKINTINGPLKNSEKISKQSMKSNNDFSGLNDKLGERNSNNNLLGDIIIVDTAIAQGLITITMAALAVMGFFSAPMLAAWAVALAKNAGLAATGVGAKLVSNQVDNKIDANNETFREGQKSLMHDDKVKNDVRRVTAKAAADKMGSIPVQQEQQAAQNAQQNGNSENTNENENSQNNSSNNVTAPSPSVRKESDTRSGFDKSSLNSELDINNPNDVKKANEYAIAYTRDVNVYDEKSKAAASTNSNTSAADSNTTTDIKLSRFNKDGAINSSKRSQRVNAASATHNGRKRR